MTEIFLIGVGLSADAFAVSLVNGINESVKRRVLKKALVTALAFGVFQAVMPVLGYLFGNHLGNAVREYGKFVTLLILGFIGVKTLIGGVVGLCRPHSAKAVLAAVLTTKALIFQAFATSIDAFATGVSFAARASGEVFLDGLVIGGVTFLICFAGVVAGGKFRSSAGENLGHYAEIAGGIILAAIGVSAVLR